MKSPGEDLCKALANKCLESLGAARALLAHGSRSTASGASRTYYAALQAVATKILGCDTIPDLEILGSTAKGKGMCRVKGERWSFVHGTTQTHVDLVLRAAKHRRTLKDLEAARNPADYEEGPLPQNDLRTMITDAETLLRSLGFQRCT